MEHSLTHPLQRLLNDKDLRLTPTNVTKMSNQYNQIIVLNKFKLLNLSTYLIISFIQ